MGKKAETKRVSKKSRKKTASANPGIRRLKREPYAADPRILRPMSMRATSAEAFASMAGVASDTLDHEIVKVLHDAGATGIMCWQIEQQIERKHQSVAGNLRHLCERGIVVRLKRKGKTDSNRSAFYWALFSLAKKSEILTDLVLTQQQRMQRQAMVGKLKRRRVSTDRYAPLRQGRREDRTAA